MIDGACLCGSTRFQITGDLAPGSLCHCSQCRRQSSHVFSSTHIPKANLTFLSEGDLRWYAASPAAKRGYCAACGSVLFWNPNDEDKISVSLGALKEPHSGHLSEHIFTQDKGAYYDIDAPLPQRETF